MTIKIVGKILDWVKREVTMIDPYKFKNFEFLKFETSQLDSSEVSIEDQESVSEGEE